MPKAFCGLETVRQKAQWTLCALWEKNLPSESRNCTFSHRKHRRTEHTKVHRDIKSTDFTEPYSQQKASPPTPLRMERGVITEIPLHVLQMFSSLSPSISRPKGVTSHTTPLSIRRGAGGEASVRSVCRRPSVDSKLCAKRLSELCALCEKKNTPEWEIKIPSVREKPPQRFTPWLLPPFRGIRKMVKKPYIASSELPSKK